MRAKREEEERKRQEELRRQQEEILRRQQEEERKRREEEELARRKQVYLGEYCPRISPEPHSQFSGAGLSEGVNGRIGIKTLGDSLPLEEMSVTHL